MDTNLLLAIGATLIVLFLLIKYISKTALKVTLAALSVAALGLYIFLRVGHKSEEVNFGEVITQYTIRDLKNAYCENAQSRTDSLKCECIIKPVSDDLNSRFSGDELAKLEKQRLKFARELIRSVNNKKEIIKAKLKENNASELLKEFKEDITKGDLKNRIINKTDTLNSSEEI